MAEENSGDKDRREGLKRRNVLRTGAGAALTTGVFSSGAAARSNEKRDRFELLRSKIDSQSEKSSYSSSESVARAFAEHAFDTVSLLQEKNALANVDVGIKEVVGPGVSNIEAGDLTKTKSADLELEPVTGDVLVRPQLTSTDRLYHHIQLNIELSADEGLVERASTGRLVTLPEFDRSYYVVELGPDESRILDRRVDVRDLETKVGEDVVSINDGDDFYLNGCVGTQCKPHATHSAGWCEIWEFHCPACYEYATGQDCSPDCSYEDVFNCEAAKHFGINPCENLGGPCWP